MNYKERLAQETSNRQEKFSRLETFEGFKKLSEKQKQMIRLSLYVQDRAGRPHMRNQARARSDETFSGTYKASAEHLREWYCHVAVFYLENELPLDFNTSPHEQKSLAPQVHIIDEEYPPDFFSEFIEIERTSLRKKIDEIGFPCTILIWKHTERNSNKTLFHSCVALGKNEAGEVVVWEKENSLQPYGLIPLDVIIAGHMNKDLKWSVRPFGRKSETVTHWLQEKDTFEKS